MRTNKRKRSLVTTALLLLVAATSAQAATAFAIPTITFGTSAAGGNTFTIGYTFTVGSTPLLISDLGIYDVDADGFTGSIQVNIWQNNGNTGNLITSGVLASGTSALLESGYRYVPVVGAITLSANTLYTIGATTTSGTDRVPTFLTNNQITVNPGVTLGSARSISATNTYPTTDVINRPNYMFANFKSPNLVPEPSTALLGAIGALALLRRRR